MPYAKSLDLIGVMKEDLEALVNSIDNIHKEFKTKSKARTYRNKLRTSIQTADELGIDRYAGLLKDYKIQLRGLTIIAYRKRGKRSEDRISFPMPIGSLDIIEKLRTNKRERMIEFINWERPDDFSLIVTPWIKRLGWVWETKNGSAFFRKESK